MAVKVQYPGIKKTVASDLKNLSLVLKAGSRMAPGLASKEVAAEITERIVEELDYELEAANHRAHGARVPPPPVHRRARRGHRPCAPSA